MKQEPYDSKADIWSFAMTILEMATGKPPWYCVSNVLLLIQIFMLIIHRCTKRSTPAHALYQACLTTNLPKFPDDLSSDCVDFMTALLQREPSKRPSVRTCITDFAYVTLLTSDTVFGCHTHIHTDDRSSTVRVPSKSRSVSKEAHPNNFQLKTVNAGEGKGKSG